MRIEKHNDGWVTTPVYVGPAPIPPLCFATPHQWVDTGEKQSISKTPEVPEAQFMIMQKCSSCGYVRVKFT